MGYCDDVIGLYTLIWTKHLVVQFPTVIATAQHWSIIIFPVRV